MHNRVTASLLLVTTLALGFAGLSYGTAEDEELAAISAQATELAPEDMSDAQRIMALHRGPYAVHCGINKANHNPTPWSC